MFTVEMDHDEIEITVLDDKDRFEDVKVFSYYEIVYIRQFNEQYNKWDLIQMTPEMYVELMTAYHKPSGAYLTDIKRR